MMRNSDAKWGWPAQAMHWLAGALILLLLFHGWWMVEVQDRALRFEHYGGHASLGYALLALMILRLAWRWLNAVPALPPESPRWMRIGARSSHLGLYVLILAASVSGWALAGTFRRPLEATFLGLVRVPAIVASQERALHELLERLHGALAWALAALIALHVAAALFHHFAKKDAVMRRMLP
jgi:cytochrome b561